MQDSRQPSEPTATPATRMVALVTGGSGGIGAAICHQLLEAGAEVVSLARTAPGWQHPRLHAVTLDLMDPEATRKAAGELAARFAISHVIHNAGALRPDLVEDVKLQDLNALVALHLASPLLLVQAALPAMKTAGFGRIVLLSSRAAMGLRTRSAYAATKSGLIGLARTWALELAPYGITVNVVAPGPIAGTAMSQEVVRPAARKKRHWPPAYRCTGSAGPTRWPMQRVLRCGRKRLHHGTDAVRVRRRLGGQPTI